MNPMTSAAVLALAALASGAAFAQGMDKKDAAKMAQPEM